MQWPAKLEMLTFMEPFFLKKEKRHVNGYQLDVLENPLGMNMN